MKAVVISGTQTIVKDNIPKPELTENSALVKVKANAVNPTDWKHVAFQLGCENAIVGCDLSGEIVELGPGADSKWKVGDQLLGLVHGSYKKYPENGAFAEYAKVELAYAVKLENMKSADSDVLAAGKINTYEAAASLPVSIFTSNEILVGGLGNKLEKTSTPQNSHPLLIWGGATSTGFHVIQLAKAFNCYTKIVAVASKKNEGILRSFGADEVYDYHDDDVISQIANAHPDIYHIVDAASTSGTLAECLKAAPGGDKPAIIVGLLGSMGVDGVTAELRKQKPNVKLENVLLYQVEGTDIELAGQTFPAKPSVRENAIKFAEVVGHMIRDGSLKSIPVKIFNGMESLPNLMEDLKAGKTSAEKLVAKL